MKRKALCEKYNLSIKTFRALVRHGHICQISFGEYEDNKDFLSSFDEEKYFEEFNKQKLFNISLGLSNMSKEAKLNRHNKLCASQKIAQNRPETKQKKQNSLAKHWSNQKNRDAQSIKVSLGWSKKSKEELDAWSKECSERSKLAYQNMSEEAKKLHSTNVGLSQTIKNQKLRDSGYYETDEWKAKSKQTQLKINNTKRLRKTFNSSRVEEQAYQILLKRFSSKDIIRQYSTKEYPFASDFYIVSLNCYIECHFSHYHNYKPFDAYNEEHLKELQMLRDKFERTPKNKKGENQYSKIIYTWTDLDVRKRQCAKNNNLNWLSFYYIEHLESWIEDYEN